MLIRAATRSDAAAIAHVHVQSWRTTYAGIVPAEYLASLDEAERTLAWQEWLASDVLAFLAEDGGRVAGFVAAGSAREPLPGYDVELYTLYLLQEVQRRGIGSALLRAVSGELLLRGHQGMLLSVLEANPAVEFYRRAGAEPLASKSIEIGGVELAEVVLGWADLRNVVHDAEQPDA